MQEIISTIKGIVNFIKDKKKFFVPGVIAVALVIAVSVFYETPVTVDGMISKADTLSQKGQVALALEEYNKIVRLYPNNYDVHLRLADVYKTVNEN
jgi:Tfp pilus assembly protein PilF